VTVTMLVVALSVTAAVVAAVAGSPLAHAEMLLRPPFASCTSACPWLLDKHVLQRMTGSDGEQRLQCWRPSTSMLWSA
jgi:hypothetical protein